MSRTPRISRPTSVPARQWRRPEVDPGIGRNPIVVAAFLGALTAALVGLIICFAAVFLVWLLAAHGDESIAQVLRASGASWLAAHLVTLTIGGNVFGLMPWGFLLIPGIFSWKSMHWALKSGQPTTARGFWLTAIYFTLSYSLISALVCFLSSTRDLFASQLSTALHCGVFCATICVSVVVFYAPNRTLIAQWLSPAVLRGLKPGLISVVTLYSCAALTTAVMLVVRLREVKSVTWLMAPHVIDAFFLTLLGIGYIPTVAAWVMSYLLGPGFVLGAHATVSIHKANVGRLPAFPILAIIPNQVPRFALIALLIPVAAAFIAFLKLERDPWQAQGHGLLAAATNSLRFHECVSLLSAGAVSGSVTALLMAAAQGALGSEALKLVGPSPLTNGITAGLFVFVVGLLLFIVPRMFLNLRASQPRYDHE